MPGEDRFLQIVSCNTHNISCLIKTLGTDDAGARTLDAAAASSACGGRTTSRRTRASRRRRRPASTTTPSSAPTTRATPRTLLSTIGWKPRHLLVGDEAQHPVHALALVRPGSLDQPTTREKVVAAAARQPADRPDRQAARQPDLLLRPRPRLLRAHPVADRDLRADAGRQRGAARSSASASRRRTATRSPRPSTRRCGSWTRTAKQLAERMSVLDRFFFREI